MYALFALFYRMQPDECIFNVHNYFHALWFSVITSATIGYGYQAPDPDCYGANLLVMFQVMTGALMQAALLGLVYSRFAAPGSRAHTIKFSNIMTCFQGPDGFMRLAFRVANMRRHQVLQPEVQLLMIRREHIGGPDGPLEYRYHELPITHISGRRHIWLGVPSIVVHKINQKSPLWGMTPESMEKAEELGLEFVALLDGIDETTSTVMQARHSYAPSDIRWGESFAGVLARGGSGALTADYSNFDLTRAEFGDTALSVGWSQRSGGSDSMMGGDVLPSRNLSTGLSGFSSSGVGGSGSDTERDANAMVDLEAGRAVKVVLPEYGGITTSTNPANVNNISTEDDEEEEDKEDDDNENERSTVGSPFEKYR